MNRTCRKSLTSSWRRRQASIANLLRHARIVTDPKKLAYLKAEARKQNANAKTP